MKEVVYRCDATGERYEEHEGLERIRVYFGGRDTIGEFIDIDESFIPSILESADDYHVSFESCGGVVVPRVTEISYRISSNEEDKQYTISRENFMERFSVEFVQAAENAVENRFDCRSESVWS